MSNESDAALDAARAQAQRDDEEPTVKDFKVEPQAEAPPKEATLNAPAEAEAGKCMVCGGKGTVSGDSGPPDRSGKRVYIEVCCPNCETGRALLAPPAPARSAREVIAEHVAALEAWAWLTKQYSVTLDVAAKWGISSYTSPVAASGLALKALLAQPSGAGAAERLAEAGEALYKHAWTDNDSAIMPTALRQGWLAAIAAYRASASIDSLGAGKGEVRAVRSGEWNDLRQFGEGQLFEKQGGGVIFRPMGADYWYFDFVARRNVKSGGGYDVVRPLTLVVEDAAPPSRAQIDANDVAALEAARARAKQESEMSKSMPDKPDLFEPMTRQRMKHDAEVAGLRAEVATLKGERDADRERAFSLEKQLRVSRGGMDTIAAERDAAVKRADEAERSEAEELAQRDRAHVFLNDAGIADDGTGLVTRIGDLASDRDAQKARGDRAELTVKAHEATPTDPDMPVDVANRAMRYWHGAARGAMDRTDAVRAAHAATKKALDEDRAADANVQRDVAAERSAWQAEVAALRLRAERAEGDLLAMTAARDEAESDWAEIREERDRLKADLARLNLKASLTHDMLRPFRYQCEKCGGMGRDLMADTAEERAETCDHCDGSGFVGEKSKWETPAPSCEGERCPCGAPAAHKVGEEELRDRPIVGHNRTSYVCAEHFAWLMGPRKPMPVSSALRRAAGFALDYLDELASESPIKHVDLNRTREALRDALAEREITEALRQYAVLADRLSALERKGGGATT